METAKMRNFSNSDRNSCVPRRRQKCPSRRAQFSFCTTLHRVFRNSCVLNWRGGGKEGRCGFAYTCNKEGKPFKTRPVKHDLSKHDACATSTCGVPHLSRKILQHDKIILFITNQHDNKLMWLRHIPSRLYVAHRGYILRIIQRNLLYRALDKIHDGFITRYHFPMV